MTGNLSIELRELWGCLLHRAIVIERMDVDSLFPRIINAVSGMLDLIDQYKWSLPAGRKVERFLLINGRNYEIVEKMPMTFGLSARVRSCDYI